MAIEFGAQIVTSVDDNTGVGNADVVIVKEPGADTQPDDEVDVAVYVELPAVGDTVIAAPVPPVDQLNAVEAPIILTR